MEDEDFGLREKSTKSPKGSTDSPFTRVLKTVSSGEGSTGRSRSLDPRALSEHRASGNEQSVPLRDSGGLNGSGGSGSSAYSGPSVRSSSLTASGSSATALPDSSSYLLHSSASTVPSNAPNIPNVVEYHLKVKPGPANATTKSPITASASSSDDNSRRQGEMKKESSVDSPKDKKKDLIAKFSRLSIDKNVFEGSTELPQVFQVKYLGSHDARGLWGIKHTRKPVDNMVTAAKSLPANTMLPLIKLIVSKEGVGFMPLDKRRQDPNCVRFHSIETISYGVQDLVYTRVFSMIVVRETENFRRISPFECHGFVCESRQHARQLTYALATAFELYSRTVKAHEAVTTENTRRRFAIDLRSPEEIEADLAVDSEA